MASGTSPRSFDAQRLCGACIEPTGAGRPSLRQGGSVMSWVMKPNAGSGLEVWSRLAQGSGLWLAPCIAYQDRPSSDDPCAVWHTCAASESMRNQASVYHFHLCLMTHRIAHQSASCQAGAQDTKIPGARTQQGSTGPMSDARPSQIPSMTLSQAGEMIPNLSCCILCLPLLQSGMALPGNVFLDRSAWA